MVNNQLIEQLRIQHGYNQETIAKMMGYDSHVAYSRKVNGKRNFTIEDVIKLCEIYQLEPNDLIIIKH